MSLQDTQDVLRSARSGDPEALGRLLETLRPRLVAWAAGRMSAALRAKVEPEDVAQEVLLAVYRDFATFRGGEEAAFFAWLFRVAENRIRDLADHHGALKRQVPAPLSFTQSSPSGAASRREDVAKVMDALGGLSDAHREVIVLLRIEDRGVPEVATLLGRTENAVRILYCRALAALRAALGPTARAP